MPTPIALRWCVVSLLPMLAGCFAYTDPLWEGANRRTMESNGAVAIVTSGEGRALVVEYAVDGGAVTPRYVLLPIDADGRAASATLPLTTRDEKWFRHAKRDDGFRELRWHAGTWTGKMADGAR